MLYAPLAALICAIGLQYALPFHQAASNASPPRKGPVVEIVTARGVQR